MMDLIVIGILAVMIAAAAGYIYKAKKSGKACIGCPDGGCCGGNCGSCGGCGGHQK